jgi:hypothetical protein
MGTIVRPWWVASASSGYSVFVATVSTIGGGDTSYSGDGRAAANVSSTNAAKLAPGLIIDTAAAAALVAAATDGDNLLTGGECVGLAVLTDTSVTPQLAVSAAPATVGRCM